jgi:Cu/Zn superoxide dismutase
MYTYKNGITVDINPNPKYKDATPYEDTGHCGMCPHLTVNETGDGKCGVTNNDLFYYDGHIAECLIEIKKMEE